MTPGATLEQLRGPPSARMSKGLGLRAFQPADDLLGCNSNLFKFSNPALYIGGSISSSAANPPQRRKLRGSRRASLSLPALPGEKINHDSAHSDLLAARQSLVTSTRRGFDSGTGWTYAETNCSRRQGYFSREES